MVEINFHSIAQEDIKELYDYLARFSLHYADSFINRLYDYIENLKQFPKMGKIYPDNNKYRQLIYQNYRILYNYKEEQDEIIIMIVVHCSRYLRL